MHQARHTGSDAARDLAVVAASEGGLEALPIVMTLGEIAAMRLASGVEVLARSGAARGVSSERPVHHS